MPRERHNLSYQVTQTLSEKLHLGESKHQAKKDGTVQEKIFSINTYESYKKHCGYFVSYCKSEHGCRTLDECRPYASEWLEVRKYEGLSSYTLKLERAAIGKLYGVDSSAFDVDIPACRREDITRSRGSASRDRNWNEKRHASEVSFFRSVGLRRSEYNRLTGDCLVFRDGKPYIHLTKANGTKGGRERYAPVVGNVELVVRVMRACGHEKVFPNGVNSNADIHSYRADYATAIYRANARTLEECKRDGSVYWCRRDRKGVWMDKKAMRIASEALGHSRISVVGEHYIR